MSTTLDQQTAQEQAALKRTMASHTSTATPVATCIADGSVPTSWMSGATGTAADNRGGTGGRLQTAYLSRHRTAIAILDAGCGTASSVWNWDAAASGRATGSASPRRWPKSPGKVYRHVRGDVDLNGPLFEYSSASHDITIFCGVFTFAGCGHSCASTASKRRQTRCRGGGALPGFPTAREGQRAR